MMDRIMSGLPNVTCYINVVLIHLPDIQSHLRHLEQALQCLADHNLKINLNKCHFAKTSVEYLGHTLTPSGIQPGLDKTDAIRRAPLPTTTSDIRSFLRLCNYFRSYVPNFSYIAQPLFTRAGWHTR